MIERWCTKCCRRGPLGSGKGRQYRCAVCDAGRRKAAASKPIAAWMHIAAINLIADHEAGLIVGATNLEAARRLVGR